MKLLIITICILTFNSTYLAHSLVGVDNGKQTQNLPKDTKKPTKNNNTLVNKTIETDIPNFPNYKEEEYKMLFDDGFSNIVDDSFQTGEEWDTFVSQLTGNEINHKYIAGNSDDYTQMDAIEAEKKTIMDHSLVDKNNITTHRTRIMAYLTLDQMVFDDLFSSTPYGYYVEAVAK